MNIYNLVFLNVYIVLCVNHYFCQSWSITCKNGAYIFVLWLSSAVIISLQSSYFLKEKRVLFYMEKKEIVVTHFCIAYWYGDYWMVPLKRSFQGGNNGSKKFSHHFLPSFSLMNTFPLFCKVVMLWGKELVMNQPSYIWT